MTLESLRLRFPPDHCGQHKEHGRLRKGIRMLTCPMSSLSKPRRNGSPDTVSRKASYFSWGSHATTRFVSTFKHKYHYCPV